MRTAYMHFYVVRHNCGLGISGQKQSTNVATMSLGLAQIDSVTQQNAGDSEQTVAAAQELARDDGELEDNLEFFRLSSHFGEALEIQSGGRLVH